MDPTPPQPAAEEAPQPAAVESTDDTPMVEDGAVDAADAAAAATGAENGDAAMAEEADAGGDTAPPAAKEAGNDDDANADGDEEEEEEEEPPSGGLLGKIKVEVKQEKMLKSGIKREREGDDITKPEVKKEKKSVRFGGLPDLPAQSIAVKLEQEAVISAGGKISEEDEVVGDDEGAKLWGEGRGEGTFHKEPLIIQAFALISQNHWNTDAWGVVLEECRNHPLEETEDVYKRYLYLYPSSAGVIQELIQAIENDERLDPEERKQRVDLVFMDRLAMANQHLNVWRQYTDYVDRKGDFKHTQSAYKFAVDRVGMDFESVRLWKEYIEFYTDRGQPLTLEIEKAIRNTYHAMLRTPLEGLETLWKDYLQWEKANGDRRIPDTLRSAHERAKHHYKQIREEYIMNIDTKAWPKPLGLDAPGSPAQPAIYVGPRVTRDFEQAALWYRLIDFEMSNPMALDTAVLVKRVSVICKKALVGLSRTPLFWYVLAKFLFGHDAFDEANIIFCEGIAANPDSLVLRFAYAHMLSHLQHSRGLKTPVKLDGDVGHLLQPPPPGLADDQVFIQTVWQGVGQGMTVKASDVAMRRHERFPPFVLGCAVFEDALSRIGTAETAEPLRVLTWIHFAKFIKTVARSDAEQERYREHYIPRACSDPATGRGEFYAALARLEQSVPPTEDEGGLDPRAIMEAGFNRMRKSGTYDATFILRYIDFLWRMGDEKSLRFLFTQLFDARGSAAAEGDWQAKCDKNALLEVYNRYVEFEVWTGELKQVHTAEARREAKFGRMRVGSCLRQLVARYSFQGLVPATPQELELFEKIDYAYFRLCQIRQSGQDAQEIHAKNLELAGTADPQEEILAAHKPANPLRTSRLQYPETRTKWRAFAAPMNRNKWTVNDDQNSDLPKDAVNMTTWEPKNAPQPEGAAGTTHGATHVEDEDDFAEMPSYVAHLARILPAKHTWQGHRPSVSKIIDLFKSLEIPPLVNGRMPTEKLQEAKKTLESIGVDTTRILERRTEARAAISQRRAMAEASGSAADKKMVDKAQLALSIILTHARQNPRQQEMRERERNNE